MSKLKMTRIDNDKGIDMFAKFISLLSSRQLDQSDYDGDCEGDNGDMGAKMFTQETISPCPPVTLRQEISPPCQVLICGTA